MAACRLLPTIPCQGKLESVHVGRAATYVINSDGALWQAFHASGHINFPNVKFEQVGLLPPLLPRQPAVDVCRCHALERSEEGCCQRAAAATACTGFRRLLQKLGRRCRCCRCCCCCGGGGCQCSTSRAQSCPVGAFAITA